MTAPQAESQVQPGRAGFQAVLAAVGVRNNLTYIVQMRVILFPSLVRSGLESEPRPVWTTEREAQTEERQAGMPRQSVRSPEGLAASFLPPRFPPHALRLKPWEL